MESDSPGIKLMALQLEHHIPNQHCLGQVLIGIQRTKGSIRLPMLCITGTVASPIVSPRSTTTNMVAQKEEMRKKKKFFICTVRFECLRILKAKTAEGELRSLMVAKKDE